MANSMLAAIAAATSSATDAPADTTATGELVATDTKEKSMSSDKPGGDPAATVTRADHDIAIAAAAHSASAAELARISGCLQAEGIKGDAGRMSAAVDMAKTSPAMSSTDIIAFVTAHVAAVKPGGASAYEATRTAAAGLSQPGNRPAKAERSGSVLSEALKRKGGK